MGSSIPFSRTLADRHASDDPRLSLEERYKNVDDYLQKVRRAIASLIELGLMLTEDTDSLLADSQRAYLEAVGDV
jgi:phage shock protein A